MHAKKMLIGSPSKIIWSDTVMEDVIGNGFSRTICKAYSQIYICNQALIQNFPTLGPSIATKSYKPQFLRLSGNVLYDVNYQSRIDTPYAESNIYQHTIQTRIDGVYKDQYPFKIYVTTRFGNSNLFRKYNDLNFQFNQSDFRRLLKERAIQALNRYMSSRMSMIDSIGREIARLKMAMNQIAIFITQTDSSQRIIENRERVLLQESNKANNSVTPLTVGTQINDELLNKRFKFPAFCEPPIAVPSNLNPIQPSIPVDKRSSLDSMGQALAILQQKYELLQSTIHGDVQYLRNELEQPGNLAGFSKRFKEANIPDSLLPKGFNTLASIRTFNIGRFVADYSELSVKNTSLTGFQVEFNPRYYYAVAIGKVDYRYRDYLVPNNAARRQYVVLARVGKGLLHGNHIIFSYYTGRRQFYNSSISTQTTVTIPEYHLAGMSVEASYKLSRFISLIGEIGKSTLPYYSRDSLQKSRWMNAISDFSLRNNEAYSLRVLSYFPRMSTRITGNIRYTGANFQSFSTFTTGSTQLKWGAKVEQSIWHRKLSIVSSVQQNEYHNPFVSTTYKSNALLASIQANLRLKKWPSIFMGYFPSYQLVKTGDDKFSESRYYTISGSATYSYSIGRSNMTTYLLYSRFYNSSLDSGLIYYNAKNLLLSNNVVFKKLSFSVNASLSLNSDYAVYTLENNSQLFLHKSFSIGAGVKNIKSSLFQGVLWGYSGNACFRIVKLGDIQFQMDKGYTPDYNRQLVPNNMGRLSYLKTF